MSNASWRPLDRVDAARLRAARLQSHHAVQWLARAARAYIPARPDDSHTNLGWDDVFGGLMTHPLPDGTRLGVKIADLSLVLSGADGKPFGTLPLDGHSDADVCTWLGEKVRARDLDHRALDEPLPYMLPEACTYAVAGLADSLAQLEIWFSNAHAMLDAIRQEMIARKNLDVPPVRCWPHHFDLDTLVTVAPGHTTGIGFEPGDEHYDEPYFYVSLYPAPVVSTLPRLPAIGHWHVKNFTAAIAPAHRIVAAADQGAAVSDFLRIAVDAAIGALTRK